MIDRQDPEGESADADEGMALPRPHHADPRHSALHPEAQQEERQDERPKQTRQERDLAGDEEGVVLDQQRPVEQEELVGVLPAEQEKAAA